MKNTFKNLRNILYLGLLLVTGAAQAALIDGIKVTPTQTSVAVGRTNTFNATWQVTSSQAVATTATLEGPAEYLGAHFGFYDPSYASFLGSYPTSIAPRSINIPAGNAPIITYVSETVVVPPYVLDSARKLGLNQIYFLRVFLVYPGSNKQAAVVSFSHVTLNIGSSSSGELSIGRMALSFDAGDINRVVGSNARLLARAQLDTQGSGLLRGVWEVAEPPSTVGEPVFRSVQFVQRYLTGSQEVVIPSPALPTQHSGTFLLRLRILEPTLYNDVPQIVYAVAEGLNAINQTITLLAPQGVTRIGAQTRFEWQSVPTAKHYRLDFYTQELRVRVSAADIESKPEQEQTDIVPGRRVTGVVVPATQQSTLLAEITRQHLQSGRRYFWQVTAIDAQGRVFATSARGEAVGE